MPKNRWVEMVMKGLVEVFRFLRWALSSEQSPSRRLIGWGLTTSAQRRYIGYR